jgi:two-component system LytT family sensor kinase
MVGNPVTVMGSILYSPYAIKYTFYVIFQAIGVYFNLYYLMPKFLEKGKYAAYISFVLLTILCVAVLIVPGYYVSASLSGRSMQELYNVDPSNYYYFFQTNTLASSAASMTLAMSVKLAKNWVQSRQREQSLQKEKLETELKFLRYQFNPHFLFNTINSIFFLIHKNPDKASASLAKFSELLRYQLYECNETMITLDRELDYLKNFIELEKLRQSNKVEVSLLMNEEQSGNLGIAPFILVTFVENAFKHVSKHSDRPNRIRISLNVENEQLHFVVYNNKEDDHQPDVIDYGGIGLGNVKRRLELIYPGRHELQIRDREESFEVELRLTLEEMELTQLMPKTA